MPIVLFCLSNEIDEIRIFNRMQKARDEGFVFAAIVSSTIQKTGFPVRAASE